MNAFKIALEKIEKANKDAVSDSWESISGYDAFFWLSGYVGALKDNELISSDEFSILREKLRQVPIHTSSPRIKSELNKKSNESNEQSNSENFDSPNSHLAKTGIFLAELMVLFFAIFITLQVFSGWVLLFMKFLLSTSGYFSDIVPVLSGMIWFKVAVPVSCVALFWLVTNSYGLSIRRSFVYWRRRFNQWIKS